MKQLSLLITIIYLCNICSYAQAPGLLYSYAGTGNQGYTGNGGLALNATLNFPTALAIDAQGNLYVVDNGNYVVRKINAITGIITTVAGNGAAGYSGDGGPAINASIGSANGIWGLALDASGNLYISDVNTARVRKVNASTGIITTVAGNGSWGAPSAGDGGLATNAPLWGPAGIAIDNQGNLYISVLYARQVRKVNAVTGIISTIAGNGTVGFAGNGGLATNASLNFPATVAIDHFGNLYIADDTNTNWGIISCKVRKVNATTGIITTYVGGDSVNIQNYGDGGLAVNAGLHFINQMNFDNFGNLLIAENGHIRKVNAATGIITTVASGGDPYAAFTEGMPATDIFFPVLWGVVSGNNGELYMDENYFIVGGGVFYKVYKVTGPVPTGNTSSFSGYVDRLCSGPQFSIVPAQPSTSMHVTTWFGDGQSLTSSFAPNSTYTTFSHNYAYSGTYSIKHILYNGSAIMDSLKYSYSYNFCRTLSIHLYYDANSNCSFDSSTDQLLTSPTTIEIDSNGIAIDTVIITSGMDYTATGNPGAIYSFKVLNSPPGLSTTCPASGIISDTLASGNNAPKYIGFHCIGSTGFDISATTSVQTGRHTQWGHITVNNNYCTPQNGIITMNKSSQYVFTSANPTPTSVSGNIITWNINNLSSYNLPVTIDYIFDVPTPSNTNTWLPPGDTIHSSILVTPVTGDANPANNICIRVDTVKSSFDPNEMQVSPRPYVVSGDQLQYTIEFENTGNDTAQNISVLDTLPNSLNIHSLAMVSSSHNCIFSKVWNGTNWVAKFDFPNIKLLDTSHHSQCTGTFVFNIKTTTGLPLGTTIFNHAAVYFDDNPPVITDTVENIIVIAVTPAVSIIANNYCPGISTTFIAAVTNGGAAPTYQWKKNGVNVGTNSPVYIYTPISGDSVKCIVTSNAILPIPATVGSNVVHIFSQLGGYTTANPMTCGAAAGSITLNGVLPNTVYPVSYTKSGIPIGPINYISNALGSLVISGLTAAVYSNIAISITGGCATVPVNNVYINNPPPPATPAVSNSTLSVCTGDVIHLSASCSQSGVIYSWTGPSFNSAVYNPNIANAQSGNAGTYSVIVTDTVTNCASAVATTVVTVNNVVTPTVSVAANDTLCSGAAMAATASANISACSYQWHVNSANVGTNSNTYTYSPANGDHISCSIIATAPSACYSATTANSNERTANVITNIVPTISITGNSTVAAGTPTVYTTTTNIVGGTYQWKVNGSNVGSNSNTYTYTPANGDVVTCVITVPGTGCFSTNSTSSNSINMVVTSLGVATVGAGNAINIYPNPAKNVLHIDNLKEETSYRIVNMLGGVVIQGVLSQGNNEIRLEAIPAGVYMLQLTYANGQREVVRVVKE